MFGNEIIREKIFNFYEIMKNPCLAIINHHEFGPTKIPRRRFEHQNQISICINLQLHQQGIPIPR